MRPLLRLFVVLASGLLVSACSVTRRLPAGSYLVQRVAVEEDSGVPRAERIPAADLEKYIRQTPNKRLLGTNFYVWLYQQADSSKHNGWNNWKRRIGEEPVLLDMELTRRSAENLKVYMDTKGYFSSQASFELDTLSRRRRARITYRTRQGEPYLIDTVSYEFRDRFLAQLLLPDTANTLVRPGAVFDITMLDAERERIARYLRRRGYYNFTVNNIEYVADTLRRDHRVAVRVVVKQHLAGYNARGEAVMENNTVYRIRRINVYPDYNPASQQRDSTFFLRLDTLRYRGLDVVYEGRPKLRPRILRQALPFYPNYIYDADQVDKAYVDLMSLGFFKSARISFTELPASADTSSVVSFVGSAPAAGGADMPDSLSAAYTREGYLSCDIRCTPALKQSFKAEIEGSTTSNFYGLKATVGYQNRNIFRGAEALDLSFTAGYEFMKARDAKKSRASEFGVTAGLTFPRFLVPWRMRRYRSVNQPKTQVEVAVNFQDRPYYLRTLSSAGITYKWANDRYSSFSLRPIDINWVNVRDLDVSFLMIDDPDGGEQLTPNRYLIESFRTQFIGGLSFGYSYNNQRRNLGGNATNIRFNLETAGNLIDAVEHLFYAPARGKDYYTIFGIRYSQYFRTDLSLSRKIMLGEKSALAGRLYGGVAMAYGNSTSVPFDRQFYAGGSNSMRGWTPRTLGQGSVADPRSPFPVQTGDVKIEANLELRFPIWGMIHGATFFDAGNVWYIRSNPEEYSEDAVFRFGDFYRQLGFNTGLGLRLDIKFAVLRLDWGIQLHNPNRPVGERWIHDFRWKNTALNFGVGYPF